MYFCPKDLMSVSFFIVNTRRRTHGFLFATNGSYLRPSTFYPRPSTSYPRPSTFYPRPSTFYPRPSTFYPRPSTFYPRPSTSDPRHSTLDKNPDSCRCTLSLNFLAIFTFCIRNLERVALMLQESLAIL